MTQIIKLQAAEINIDPKEVAVYLGYYSVKPDEAADALMCDCAEEFRNCASFIACCEKVPVKIKNGVDLGFMKVNSKSLEKNLAGCDYAYIMAATTGIDAHRLIERNSVILRSKALLRIAWARRRLKHSAIS